MTGFNVLNFGNNSRNKRCCQYLKFFLRNCQKGQCTHGSLVGKREGLIKYKQLRILAGNLCLKGRLSMPLKKGGSALERGDEMFSSYWTFRTRVRGRHLWLTVLTRAFSISLEGKDRVGLELMRVTTIAESLV